MTGDGRWTAAANASRVRVNSALKWARSACAASTASFSRATSPAGALELLGEARCFALQGLESRLIGAVPVIRLGELSLGEGDGLLERGALARQFQLGTIKVCRAPRARCAAA